MTLIYTTTLKSEITRAGLFRWVKLFRVFTLVGFAGIDLLEWSVFFWRGKVFYRMEGVLGFEII